MNTNLIETIILRVLLMQYMSLPYQTYFKGAYLTHEGLNRTLSLMRYATVSTKVISKISMTLIVV